MADRNNSRRGVGSSLRAIAAIAGGAALAAALASSAIAQAPLAAPLLSLYSPDGDPLWAEPYVDVDEWRDAPVRHRYVHGGFKGTDTRFSFYFPPKEQYQGHFFQHITPVPDDET
ncbi:MAG: hypothetical protein ABW194_06145, partial [Novosphingobium sp.]